MKRWAAYASSVALASGLTLAGGAPAQAAPDDVSEGLGKFLGGEAVGINLDDIAEVNGAFAENPSGENPVVTNPLGAEVLNALDINLGDGLQLLGENGVIQLGAVNQYGEAQPDGDARAASGAVSDQGAISVGGSDEFPSNASVNLDALLPEDTENLVSDLSLELGALSSSAEQLDGGEVVTDYDVASATLGLESPAVGGVYTELLNTVDELQGSLDGLSGNLEDLLGAELGLGSLGVSTDVSFTPPNLSELLPDDVVGESSGVTVDLTTGAVTVDLDTLLAANPDLPNLNEMPANSELLSGEVTAAIADGITQAVTDVVTDIVTNLENTIAATELGVEVGINIPIAGSATVSLDATLSQLLDGEAEDVVSVDSSGAIALIFQLLPVDDLTGLGDLVFNLVGGLVGDSLDVLGDLEGVVDGITGPLAEEVVGPLLEVVNQVVAVTVNAQPETGDLGEDSSTVRALQVSLLPASPLAQVNLASSTVRGTDAAQLDPSVTVDPSEVQPGESVSVDGTGYTPDSTVTVAITDEEGNVVDTIEEVPTDEDGNFSTEWTVPEGTDPGDLTVTATDDTDPEASDSDTLTILEDDGGADATEDAEATADVDADAAADAAADPDADATEDEDADADADADPAADVDADASVDASASASASADADATADPAAQAAAQEAADADADDAASASADADATADPAAAAAAEAAADEDASVEASANSDSASEAAAQAAAHTEGDSDSAAEASAAEDADASAAAQAAANEDASSEASSDAAADAAADPDADATEEADADADATGDDDGDVDTSVTVEPDSAQPGDDVTISGSGFVPDSTVTVDVTDADGNVIDTIEGVEVNADGQFETTWTVPEGTDAGELTVTATDDSDGDISGSATLTIIDGAAAGDDGDDDDLAVTGAGGAMLLVGISALLLLAGAAGLHIARNRRHSTE